MAPQIATKQDLYERKAFCQKMMERNRSVGNFEESDLSHRLKKHLTLTLYNTIVERYFRSRYSLLAYIRYLFSGMALRCGCKYETKFLLKSLLCKKA